MMNFLKLTMRSMPSPKIDKLHLNVSQINSFIYSPNHYLQSSVNGFHQPCLTYFSNHSFRAMYLILLRKRKIKSCQGWKPEHPANQLKLSAQQQLHWAKIPGVSVLMLAAVPAAESIFHALSHSLTTTAAV